MKNFIDIICFTPVSS